MPESNETTGWQQVRHYEDHLGHPVVLEQYIQDYEADPSHLVPIQIYSTVPLDADHEDLRAYCLGSDGDWDLYTEAGGAPDLLAFNRSFSRSHADVDQEQRREDVDDEPGLAGFELSIERVQCQIEVSQVIVGDIFVNAQHPGLAYALNADEGVPANAESPPGDEAEIRQQLERQSTEINYIFDSTFRIMEDEDAGVVTFTNTSEDEPDLQYLVYAPFLSHWRNVPHSSIPLLKATVRLFSSSLFFHLPSQQTINLKFFILESTSWSSIRPTHSHVLQALRAPFPVGPSHL